MIFGLVLIVALVDHFPAYLGASVPVEAIVLSRGHECGPTVPLPQDGRQGTGGAHVIYRRWSHGDFARSTAWVTAGLSGTRVL